MDLAERKKSQAIEQDVQSIDSRPVFTKEQILMSASYQNKRDLLDALLKDGESYTMETVNKTIKGFMERKVD